jgi:hypothetical protein
MHIGYWWESQKKRDHWKDQEVGGSLTASSSRFLVTASNSGDSSASVLKSLPAG